MVNNWRKSSRSGDGATGGCVGLGFDVAEEGVTDMKNLGGPALVFRSGTGWGGLVEAVKTGRFPLRPSV